MALGKSLRSASEHRTYSAGKSWVRTVCLDTAHISSGIFHLPRTATTEGRVKGYPLPDLPRDAGNQEQDLRKNNSNSSFSTYSASADRTHVGLNYRAISPKLQSNTHPRGPIHPIANAAWQAMLCVRHGSAIPNTRCRLCLPNAGYSN